MPKLLLLRVALPCALLLGAFAVAPAARAQVGPVSNPGQLLNQGASMAPQQTIKHKELPPALPGATPSDNAAPATEIPSEMSPNAALFDAINRGDVGAARDALSRGAQLDARNVLGMTPMELSVDLAHNDISFLLLSYRGEQGSGGSSAAPKVTAKAPPPPAKPVRPIRTAEHVPPARAHADTPVDPSAAPQAPRLFANDGGTPVPNAGFLGFGSQAPSR